MQRIKASFMGMIVMSNIISPLLLTGPAPYGIIGGRSDYEQTRAEELEDEYEEESDSSIVSLEEK